MIKILIADDTIHIRSILVTFLNRYDCLVDVADDGQEAIEKFEQDKHDAVLLDLNMPKVYGLNVLEEILKIDENANICIVSAQSNPQIIESALDLGAKGYIVKPFKKEQIIAKVEELTHTMLALKSDSNKNAVEDQQSRIDKELSKE